ncbi:MAG: FAD-dependent oxidoreductase [Anaerolineales bacterium]|nr:FAD-dependent oxidoreductase [Anaerolineales bacterium]
MDRQPGRDRKGQSTRIKGSGSIQHSGGSFRWSGLKLKSIKTRDIKTGENRRSAPAAAFVFIGQQPNTEFIKGYLRTDDSGFILTGHDLKHINALDALPFETSVPGIFAAGDARHGSVKQVASAVGEGAAASISIREFLRKG